MRNGYGAHEDPLARIPSQPGYYPPLHQALVVIGFDGISGSFEPSITTDLQ